MGVEKVFTPGTSLDEAVDFVRQRFGQTTPA
jgi:methylmalonyl-CoA mutase cobalamin-binding subunit